MTVTRCSPKRKLMLALTVVALCYIPTLPQEQTSVVAATDVRNIIRKAFDPEQWSIPKVHESLYEAFKQHPREAVKQLLLFLTEEIPGGKNEFLIGAIADFRIVDLAMAHEFILRRELIPYLRLTEHGTLVKTPEFQDSKIPSMAYKILALVDSLHVARYPFLGQSLNSYPRKDYIRILGQYGDNIPAPLVEYLFDQFKGEALFWIDQAYTPGEGRFPDDTRKGLEKAVHFIETAAWRVAKGYTELAQLDVAHQEVRKLANEDLWYARRYAVHALLNYPLFRTPELVKKLQNDPHPLVRERAKHIKFDPAQQK